MLKALIFDLDGVIVDSEPMHCRADVLTMRDYGMEMAEEDFVRYVGVSGPDMWAELIEKFALPDPLETVIARQSAYKKKLLCETKLKAIPGVAELLNAAEALGLAVGVASSSPRYFIEAVLENLGFRALIQAVASGEEVARGKPAPDVFLKAAELLGVNPSECLVIEDSGAGVRAAKAAGMKCIGFRSPNSGEQDFSLADEVVTGMDEIKLNKYT